MVGIESPNRIARVPTNTTKATGIPETMLAENAMGRDLPAVPREYARRMPIVRRDMNARVAELNVENAELAVIWAAAVGRAALAAATAPWELGQQGTAAAPATYAGTARPSSTIAEQVLGNALINNLNSIGGEIRRCFFVLSVILSSQEGHCPMK